MRQRFLTNSARIALSTARIMTPTSAKIASHMFARPSAPSDQADELDADGKDDVLVDDAQALAGDPDRLGDLHRIVVHQDHVRGLDRRVRPHGAHGDADVRAAQHRRVVDAVAHEGELCALGLLREELLHLGDLVRGQQLAVHPADPQVRGDLLGDALGCRR